MENNQNPIAHYPLAQMVMAPLKGQRLGLPESQFVLAEWTAPGHTEGPPLLMAPLHVHYADNEAWYILEGTLTFRLGDQEVEAPSGTAVLVPPGVPHTFWNPEAIPARYLIIMTQNIQRLISDLHASGQRDLETMQAIYQQHDSALIV